MCAYVYFFYYSPEQSLLCACYLFASQLPEKICGERTHDLIVVSCQYRTIGDSSYVYCHFFSIYVTHFLLSDIPKFMLLMQYLYYCHNLIIILLLQKNNFIIILNP